MAESRFRPVLSRLDDRDVPSAAALSAVAASHSPGYYASPTAETETETVTAAAPATVTAATVPTATAEDKRLTSEALRVQDYVDGLLSIAAGTLDQTTRTAATDGGAVWTEGSKTVVFQPLPAPGGNGGAPGQGAPGTGGPPAGAGFTNGLPGVTSGTVVIDWKGSVRTKGGAADAVYRVSITAVTDVTIEDTARPGRVYTVPAGQTITYTFGWTNRGGDVRYDTRGVLSDFQLIAREGGSGERLTFNAAFDIAVTKSDYGDRVDVSFQTVTFVRGSAGRHHVALSIGVTDTSAGRQVTDARYHIDGRAVDPGYTANEI